ncbi:MAG TPA: transcriptional regulator [Allosphingosinicella sp.]|nr:transcriptional regulator [Allosphingosinicella sp.]
MAEGGYRFDRFLLAPEDRRLTRDGAPVEINARYLDALALLVREQGRLVTKDRFLEEVWRGVPVTDEALTQCIKTLRRQLGDDAARPRFIETVPKHGYRFIAPVERVEKDGVRPESALPAAVSRAAGPAGFSWRRLFLLGGAGTIGGGAAGIVGGLAYGFAGASQPLGSGMGTVSVLLVLLWLTLAAALTGAAGVGFGIASSWFVSRRFGAWSIVGGAAGGMAVGAVVKLLGVDAFNLLLGRSPGDMTGGAEGALLGGAVGLGAWLAGRASSFRRGIAVAGAAGAAGGMLVIALGGRLMAGSLDLLARSFPGSRLRLDPIGGLLGEKGFGSMSQLATGALEGLLFGVCIVGAMMLALRNLEERT